MSKAKLSAAQIAASVIVEKVHLVRAVKVMLDKDLAEMYGVETFNLHKAVKRKINRFPADFMIQLSKEEFQNLIFQNGISKSWGGTRNCPMPLLNKV